MYKFLLFSLLVESISDAQLHILPNSNVILNGYLNGETFLHEWKKIMTIVMTFSLSLLEY